MSDGTIERRMGELISIMVSMNRTILETQMALYEVLAEMKDKETKDKILQHINKSHKSMIKTLEMVDEYFKSGKPS